MSLKLLKVFIVVSVLTYQTQGYSVGAPPAACDQMVPRHGLNKAQTSEFPFQLNTDGSSVSANSEGIEVTLSSPTGDKFLGFLIQARDDNDTIQGIFSSKIHKMISCNSDVNSTVTHRIPDSKTQVMVQWFPFATFRGNVTFRATVVQDFTTFWTGIISEKVTVVDYTAPRTTTTAPTTTTASSTTTVETTEAPIRGLLSGLWKRTKLTKENIYCGCGVTKGCSGLPLGCEADQNCESLFTYTKVDQDYQFEIMGEVDPNTVDGYVAGGLSLDNRMGSDSVVACRAYNREVDVTMTWNDDKSNQFHINEKEGLYNYQMYQIDGKIYCRYNRATKMVINGITFDLDEGNFYVMVASGPLTSDGRLSYHSRRSVTEA